ncbi:MAG: RING finger domain-containing protein, partial [Candidatus Heimdallarchaeota archaeon]
TQEIFFYVAIVVPGVALILFNIIFAFMRKKIPQGASLETELQTRKQFSESYERKLEAYGSSIEEIKHDVSHKEDEKLDVLIVDVYQGEIGSNICPICKLPFQKTDSMLQCKNCLSIFHTEHLKQWLKDHSDCPVCETKLKY